MKHLDKIIKFIGTATYDTFGGGYIWGSNQKGQQLIAEIPEIREDEALVSIRGWGAIQHMFSTQDEAEEFQDELGTFVADAINEKIQRDGN